MTFRGHGLREGIKKDGAIVAVEGWKSISALIEAICEFNVLGLTQGSSQRELEGVAWSGLAAWQGAQA